MKESPDNYEKLKTASDDASRSLTDELNDCFDMFEYLVARGYDPMLIDEEQEHLTLYFFCMIPGHEDHHGELVVDWYEQRFRCDHCGRQGGAVEFIEAVDGVSREEAMERAGRYLQTRGQVPKDRFTGRVYGETLDSAAVGTHANE